MTAMGNANSDLKRPEIRLNNAISGIDAVQLLIDHSVTLRVKSVFLKSSPIYCAVSMHSPSILRMLLQSGKPSYGLEETVIGMDFTRFPCFRQPGRQSYLDSPEDVMGRFDVTEMRRANLGSPLQHFLLRLVELIFTPLPVPFKDGDRLRFFLRRLKTLWMLHDAGVTMHTLDLNSRQFICCIREWFNLLINNHDNANLDYSVVTICCQILDQTERFLCSPRRLDQLCRTRIRHYLNIQGVNVKEFAKMYATSHLVIGYLLYHDVSDPTEYMKNLAPQSGIMTTS